MRKLVAEALGTAMLLIAVVGSGILGERLAGGNIAIALLAGSVTTAAMLFALIQWLGPLSGAHFNPLVSLAMAVRGDISVRDAAAYGLAQVAGGFAGVGIANTMFELPVYFLSTHTRGGAPQLLSEFICTFGLVGSVWMSSRLRSESVPGIVACYVGATFWFSPTGFANPAVTVARAFTNTLSGIRIVDVPEFIIAQLAGSLAAVLLFRWLQAAEISDEID